MFEELVQFVAAQDAGREIDHSSWSTCVVGDFVEEVEYGTRRRAGSYIYRLFNSDEIDLEKVDYVYDMLNESNDRDGPQTYGELVDVFKDIGVL